MLPEQMIKAKLETQVLYHIREAGVDGLIKTKLLQMTRARTGLLTQILNELVHAGLLVARQGRSGKWSLGRQPMRYWRTELAPPLTVPDPGDIPILELGADPPKGTTCEQCGAAIPYAPGRQPRHCSDTCRELAAHGGVRVVDLLSRAKDPLVFGQCATLLVTIDLLCRGFQVTPLVYQSGANLIVYDHDSAVLLTVIPISEAGYFPPPEGYNSLAAVHRDGRIKYGGKNPLVTEPEKIESVEMSECKVETPVESERRDSHPANANAQEDLSNQ